MPAGTESPQPGFTKAVVALSIADSPIQSHVTHALATTPLPGVIAYLTQTYSPTQAELLSSIQQVTYARGDTIEVFWARGAELHTQMTRVAAALGAPPLISEQAFLNMMLAKLPYLFADAVAKIAGWNIEHGVDCPMPTAINLLTNAERARRGSTNDESGPSNAPPPQNAHTWRRSLAPPPAQTNPQTPQPLPSSSMAIWLLPFSLPLLLPPPTQCRETSMRATMDVVGDAASTRSTAAAAAPAGRFLAAVTTRLAAPTPPSCPLPTLGATCAAAPILHATARGDSKVLLLPEVPAPVRPIPRVSPRPPPNTHTLHHPRTPP